MAGNTRKQNFKVIFLSSMAIFLIATLMLVPAAPAETKTVKYKMAAPITKMEVIPVPDMKGHVIGVLERRGVAIYENGETAAYHSLMTFDSFKGEGAWSGYSDLSFEDGSTTILKIQGTAAGDKPRLITGTGEYIKGTGRFEGIKGEVTISGKYVTPYTKDETKGDAFFEVTSTYTLPQK